jgi:hypothetical protein
MGRRAPERSTRRLASFAKLAKDLHGEGAAGERRKVISKHARKLATGTPRDGNIMVCRPSNAEVRGEVLDMGSVGKVIYDDWAAASKVAEELYRCGEGRQYPYLCPRTRDGHHHLTSKAPWRRFDMPGLCAAADLPTTPTNYRDTEQAVSYDLTRQRLRPPGDLMAAGNEDKIHRWYLGEVARRWAEIKNTKGTTS